MIYQFNDAVTKSSAPHEINENNSSTIYCNSNITTGISNNDNSIIDLRRNSAYSASIKNGHNFDDCQKVDIMDSRSNTNDLIIANRRLTSTAPAAATSNGTNRNCRARKLYDGADGSETGSSKSTASTFGSTCTASSCSASETSSSSGEPNLPYPGFPEIALRYLSQDTRPRNWCLQLITNPWFERVSILVIIFNCVTLGMYQPCVDDECVTNRCKILQVSC